MVKICYLHGDLFERTPDGKAQAHCVSMDLKMGRGIAVEFKKRYGGLDELKKQKPMVGKTLVLSTTERRVYYIVTKHEYYHKPIIITFGMAIHDLREKLDHYGDKELYIPLIGCGLDKLGWKKDVLPILKMAFEGWSGTIYVCRLRN